MRPQLFWCKTRSWCPLTSIIGELYWWCRTSTIITYIAIILVYCSPCREVGTQARAKALAPTHRLDSSISLIIRTHPSELVSRKNSEETLSISPTCLWVPSSRLVNRSMLAALRLWMMMESSSWIGRCWWKQIIPVIRQMQEDFSQCLEIFMARLPHQIFRICKPSS